MDCVTICINASECLVKEKSQVQVILVIFLLFYCGHLRVEGNRTQLDFRRPDKNVAN